MYGRLALVMPLVVSAAIACDAGQPAGSRETNVAVVRALYDSLAVVPQNVIDAGDILVVEGPIQREDQSDGRIARRAVCARLARAEREGCSHAAVHGYSSMGNSLCSSTTLVPSAAGRRPHAPPNTLDSS